RRVPRRLDFDQLVDLVGLGSDAGRAGAGAELGRIEEEVERELLRLTPHELLQRGVEPGQLDLGDLCLLVQRVFGGIVLHRNRLRLTLIPLDQEDRLLRLGHFSPPLQPQPPGTALEVTRVSLRARCSRICPCCSASVVAATMRPSSCGVSSALPSTTCRLLVTSWM